MKTKHVIAPALLLALASITTTALADCESNQVRAAPDTRFIDNRDGTITDLLLGVMWQKCAEGREYNAETEGCTGTMGERMNWSQALNRAQQANTNGDLGYSDWRVPNAKELVSLYDTACNRAAMNETYFVVHWETNRDTFTFWSSTPSVDDPSQAYGVFYLGGHSSRYSPMVGPHNMAETNALRLVRPLQ